MNGVVFQTKRIVKRAERTAALADDGLLALVQLAADDQERRQSRGPFLPYGTSAGNDGAGRRSSCAGGRLAVKADSARNAPGQADSAGDPMIVRESVQRSDNGQLVGHPGDLRKQ